MGGAERRVQKPGLVGCHLKKGLCTEPCYKCYVRVYPSMVPESLRRIHIVGTAMRDAVHRSAVVVERLVAGGAVMGVVVKSEREGVD